MALTPLLVEVFDAQCVAVDEDACRAAVPDAATVTFEGSGAAWCDGYELRGVALDVQRCCNVAYGWVCGRNA